MIKFSAATKSLSNNKTKIFLAILLIVFYGFLIRPIERNIFNVSFVDEQDTFATAQWVLKGKVLHKDVYYQHQPIPTLTSAIVQKITKPNSIFLLIKRHREFIFLFSATTFLILTLKYGYIAVVMAIFWELTKSVFLGNLFLAEAIVIPLLQFLVIFTLRLADSQKKQVGKVELFLVILGLIFIFFTSLPLWFFIGVCSSVIFFNLTKKLKSWFIVISLSLFLITFLLLLKVISLPYYLHDTIYITYKLVIPTKSAVPILDQLSNVVFFPFKALTFPNHNFYLILKVISLGYISTLLILIYARKYKFTALSFLLLATMNGQAIPFEPVLNVFHLAPMYAVLLWLTIIQIDKVTSLFKFNTYKMVLGLAFFGLLATFITPHGYKELTLQVNRYDQWYQYYSKDFDYGETIRLLSEPDDSLLVIPSGPLIYWQSDLLPATPFFNSYNYMWNSKSLTERAKSSFIISQPEFVIYNYNDETCKVYCDLIDQYTQIYSGEGPSGLYIHREKLPEITDKQWVSVKRYGFSLK